MSRYRSMVVRIIQSCSPQDISRLIDRSSASKTGKHRLGETFPASGSEPGLPDFLHKISPVYLSAEFIGMKVIPEVFRKMRYQPEPVDHDHV